MHNINRIGPYAIILGILYWPLEAAIHAYVFQEGAFLKMLLTIERDEIWMRLIISAAFITLGIMANNALKQQGEFIERLKQQEARSRRIIETALDAYISIDENSMITDWNPKAESIFGWSRRMVVGKPLTETIIPERYREMHMQGIKRYLETSSGPRLYKPITAQACTRLGEEITIEMAIVPLLDGGNTEFYTFIKQLPSDVTSL